MTIKDICFLFDEVKVLCALRSQEEYANSLYNITSQELLWN